MEGVLVVDHLDLASLRGGNVSHVVTVNPFVTDGKVTIDLVRVKGDPLINGIEVFDDGQLIPSPTIAPEAILQPTEEPFSMPLLPVSANTTMAPVNGPTIGSSNFTNFQDIVINCGGMYMNKSS